MSNRVRQFRLARIRVLRGNLTPRHARQLDRTFSELI
jgi:hypothetical protein